jgi:hypothetical protein
MKGLTVCQPYAHVIALPDSSPMAKRIENRTWGTNYRGLVLIHAGKSRDWLDPDDEEEFPTMVFGAVVAIANLVDCVRVEHLPDHLKANEHAHGPYCWLLDDVRPLATPIPWRGAQGLWYVDTDLFQAVKRQAPEIAA